MSWVMFDRTQAQRSARAPEGDGLSGLHQLVQGAEFGKGQADRLQACLEAGLHGVERPEQVREKESRRRNVIHICIISDSARHS